MDEREDIKTTVLTNLPIVTEEAYPEHILPDDLGVFDNSDGNLTINTVQQVVEVPEPEEDISESVEVVEETNLQLKHEEEENESTTVYIMQIGEPVDEEMEDGEYEEYELCTEGEEEEEEEPEEDAVREDTEEEEAEQEDSLVDDPTYGEEEKDEEEPERFDCETCDRTFKTPAVSICFVLLMFSKQGQWDSIRLGIVYFIEPCTYYIRSYFYCKVIHIKNNIQ